MADSAGVAGDKKKGGAGAAAPTPPAVASIVLDVLRLDPSGSVVADDRKGQALAIPGGGIGGDDDDGGGHPSGAAA